MIFFCDVKINTRITQTLSENLWKSSTQSRLGLVRRTHAGGIWEAACQLNVATGGEGASVRQLQRILENSARAAAVGVDVHLETCGTMHLCPWCLGASRRSSHRQGGKILRCADCRAASAKPMRVEAAGDEHDPFISEADQGCRCRRPVGAGGSAVCGYPPTSMVGIHLGGDMGMCSSPQAKAHLPTSTLGQHGVVNSARLRAL
jgi:hypothetical protein